LNGCSRLMDIFTEVLIPPVVQPFTFYLVNKLGCTLHVPAGRETWYRASLWWNEFQFVYEDMPTGIDVISTPGELSVYPNPASESFRVGGIDEPTLVTVFDMNGKMVLQQMVNPDKAVVVGHLPKGIYFVKVNGKTMKVVKN
jgi:hypothetical protein